MALNTAPAATASASAGPSRMVGALSAVEFIALAAVWGGSFLFGRVAVPSFGPWALAWVRVAGAALCLLPWLWWRGDAGALRRHWRPIFIAGLFNSALPFAFYGYAMLTINAGLAAILNATTPLFGAVIAWLWLHERLDAGRVLGLAVGFGGVTWLVWDRVGLASQDPWAVALAIAACLVATAMYGFAACYAKRYLGGVSSTACATGSQLSSALALAVPAALYWPAQVPPLGAWLAMAGLAVLCTAAAYLMFFRLIARLGATRTIAVTFLIPAFGVVWGWLLLDEAVSATMLAACAVILCGTALTTGTLRLPARR